MLNLLRWKIPKRYVIALMISIAFMRNSFLETNLTMVLTGMPYTDGISNSNESARLVQNFDWNSEQKGIILSTSSYGYLLCPLAGFLAAILGGSETCSIANFTIALITSATPFLFENTSFFVVAFFYTIIGISKGVHFAGVSQLLPRWTPPNERSRFVAAYAMGGNCGAIISLLVSGSVLQTWGANVLFYSSGFISFVWFWIWIWVVKSDSSEDPWISEAERRYLRERIRHVNIMGKLKYPWKRILTCVPLWFGLLSIFTMALGQSFINVGLSQFIVDTYNVNIQEIGYMMTIPHISSLSATYFCGTLCDHIKSRKILSVPNMHKLNNGITLFTGFVTFLMMALKPNLICNLVSIVIYESLSSFILIDIVVLILDLTTKYAAPLECAIDTWSNVAGSVAPIIVGLVVSNHSLFQWDVCFYGLSVLYLCVGLIYVRYFPNKEFSLYDTRSELVESEERRYT